MNQGGGRYIENLLKCDEFDKIDNTDEMDKLNETNETFKYNKSLFLNLTILEILADFIELPSLTKFHNFSELKNYRN